MRQNKKHKNKEGRIMQDRKIQEKKRQKIERGYMKQDRRNNNKRYESGAQDVVVSFSSSL